MKTKIMVGSRRSRLALIQTESVIAAIKEANPQLEISLSKIVTAGDRDRQTQLDRIGIAVFVKELENALLDGRIDLAVHSLKDVPVDISPGLALLAVPERLDPRDVLIAGSKLNELAPGLKIGTGSLRRTLQIKHYRPDLEVRGIRGNIDTRLQKFTSGEVDGIITAAAAMTRLGWQDKITEYLPTSHFLPSAGQGALAIQARHDDKEIAELIAPLNHLPAWQSVAAERAFLRALGGGCRAPIAALGTVTGAILKLEGMIADVSGANILYSSEEGPATSTEETGQKLAQKMLLLGAAEFLDKAKSG